MTSQSQKHSFVSMSYFLANNQHYPKESIVHEEENVNKYQVHITPFILSFIKDMSTQIRMKKHINVSMKVRMGRYVLDIF